MLRPPLRQVISNDGLQEVIIEALTLNPERNVFREKPEQLVFFMNMTSE